MKLSIPLESVAKNATDPNVYGFSRGEPGDTPPVRLAPKVTPAVRDGEPHRLWAATHIKRRKNKVVARIKHFGSPFCCFAGHSRFLELQYIPIRSQLQSGKSTIFNNTKVWLKIFLDKSHATIPKWHTCQNGMLQNATPKITGEKMGRPGTVKPGQVLNPHGRPPGKAKATILLEALERAAKARDTTFFDHVAEQALTDNTVLNAVLKKVVPDLKHVEASLDKDSTLRVIVVKETNHGR